MGILNLFAHKKALGLAIPDISSLPESERPKALQDVVSIINGQRIEFGFRKVYPDTRGQEILKSVAEGIRFLPEYTISVEGHSNLAKTEDKLTAEDQVRIKKLSEDRADACARLLKASGVTNEITCVGKGALKGESKGCVQLVVCKKGTPQPAKDSQAEQPEVSAAGTDLPQEEMPAACLSSASTLTPDSNVKDASAAQTTGDQVQDEQSSPTETDRQGKIGSSAAALIEAVVSPADVDFKVVEPASVVAIVGLAFATERGLSDPPAPASAPAHNASDTLKAEAWEPPAHAPWFMACCTSKPTVEECPMKGLPVVTQMQLLQ